GLEAHRRGAAAAAAPAEAAQAEAGVDALGPGAPADPRAEEGVAIGVVEVARVAHSRSSRSSIAWERSALIALSFSLSFSSRIACAWRAFWPMLRTASTFSRR